MGSTGYRLAEQVGITEGDAIVEVGRGPESTPLLARLATERGALLWSIDPGPLNDSGRTLAYRSISCVVEDAIAEWEPAPVRFAYLDGHDWPYPDIGDLTGQRQAYEARGQGWGFGPSAESHLTAAKLVAPHVPVGGLVVFDDTWRTARGEYDGKGRYAVPWLLSTGWTVTDSHPDTPPNHHGYVALTPGAAS